MNNILESHKAIPLIVYFALCVQFASAGDNVVQGEITVNEEDLKNASLLRLDGEWAFEPGSEISANNRPQLYSTYQLIPDSWNNYLINKEPVPLHGANYYHIRIRNPDRIDNLAILVYGFVMDYKIWVNGKATFMTKGYLKEALRPERTRDIIDLPSDHIIDIEIRITNEIHYQSGMTVVPMLGRKMNLARSEELRSSFEMILIGCLLFMVVYHMVLFFQIKKWSYLLLGLACLVVFIRALIVFDGSLLLFKMFPQLSYALSKKIEFFFVYSTIFLLPLFIEHLFNEFRFQIVSKVLIVIGSVMMLMVLFTPPSIFANALNLYHALYLLSSLYVYYLIYVSIRLKKRGAWIVAIGTVVSFIFIFMEIIRNSDLVDFYHAGPNLVNTGVVVYLFFQTVVISSVFANYRVETVRKTMELKNSQLERVAIENELKYREKELADYTFTMIQRNRFLDELETAIHEGQNNKGHDAQQVLKKLHRSIRTNRQSRNEWDDFNKHFGNVHSDFFNKLRKLYPQLSSNDYRHCALIKMNLSLKESADILGVDHKSIKTARYRMRKKMGLPESEKLKDIIADL